MSLFQGYPFGALRKNPRHEVHFLAQLDIGASVPLDCMISDLSESGAKLTVRDDTAVPDRFTLVLRRHCRVVRRLDGQLGVQFL